MNNKKWKKKQKKTVVEGSVAGDMAKKSLKVDSYVVKWQGVEDL